MRWFGLPILAGMLLASAPLQGAEVRLDKKGRVRANGDFRLRFESDWDSLRSDASRREDRDRLRIRARFEMKFLPSSRWTIGLRLRSGSTASQQSPHLTIADFDGNPRGDAAAVFDKYYLQFRGQRLWAWAGRNSFPFWKQNELFWDDDATPAGLALGLGSPGSKGSLALNAGLLALPDGGVGFNGKMAALQGVLRAKAGRSDFVAAGGVFRLFGASGAKHLRNGNGARDYTILAANLQGSFPLGERPLKLGLDLMRNIQGYSSLDPDPFTAAHRDEQSGAVASILWGDLAKKGNWMGGYFYAPTSKPWPSTPLSLRTIGCAGDPAVRLIRATSKHELRLAYALSENANLVARLYLVEAISSVQDGKRFRLDFNIKF